jgi:uncharacterized C2H2 Zn-finger protein
MIETLAETGILDELLEENRIMKEQLKKIISEDIIESLSGISFSELVDSIKISGVLLAEGIHNGIFYSSEEIKNMVERYRDRIIGMDITVEHERSDKYGKRTVGKIINVKWEPLLKAALYEAKITDKEAIEDIKEGTLRATSLRLKEKKVTMGDFTTAKELFPINNSLTKFPACNNCNVFHIEDLSLKYYGIKNSEVENKMESKGEVSAKIEVEVIDLKKFKCPSCKKTFDTWEEFFKHWNKEHKEEYGTYKSKEKYKEYKEYKEEYKTSEDIMEENVAKGEIKIAYNKKTKKYILMVGTGKKKLAWKIVGQYDTKEEAKKASEKLSEELYSFLNSKECPKCREEMKGEEKVKCPVCNKEFDSYKKFLEHWEEKHKDKYGEYGKYSKYGKYGEKYGEKKELSESNKDKTEKTEEGEEELRRTRCPYCGELYESLNKHLPRCTERKKILSELFKCNYCEETFSNEMELIKHLENCSKYKLSKEELSEKNKEEKGEEKKGEETTSIEKKEEEKEEKKEEVKEEEKKTEEEKKEKEEVTEIVEKKPEKKEKISPKELLKKIKESKGDILEKAAELILKREEKDWIR